MSEVYVMIYDIFGSHLYDIRYKGGNAFRGFTEAKKRYTIKQ